MRTSAITAAVLALSLSGTVSANDDFSALLADLSFGDAPTEIEPAAQSLTVVPEESVQELMPLPEGLSMPGLLESASDAPVVTGPVASPFTADTKPVEPSAPQVALMDPIPATTPAKTVDFDAAFALQETDAVPAKTVGHLHGHHCESPAYGDGCYNSVICRPRTPVSLPSSTLYQYFRSHPCYTNVWDGYQIHCGSHHKHLHGECDCFKGSGCGACDVHGQCDSCQSR